jgi:hypothetical protein
MMMVNLCFKIIVDIVLRALTSGGMEDDNC